MFGVAIWLEYGCCTLHICQKSHSRKQKQGWLSVSCSTKHCRSPQPIRLFGLAAPAPTNWKYETLSSTWHSHPSDSLQHERSSSTTLKSRGFFDSICSAVPRLSV